MTAQLEVNYHPATSEDEAFLRGLFVSSRAEQFSHLPLSPEQLVSMLDLQFRAQHQHYQSAYPNSVSRLISFGHLPVGTILTDESDLIVLVNIVILPEYQNRGIGSVVLRDLLERASELKKPIHLSVDPHNPALRLYQRLGFEVIAQPSLHLEMRYCPDTLTD